MFVKTEKSKKIEHLWMVGKNIKIKNKNKIKHMKNKKKVNSRINKNGKEPTSNGLQKNRYKNLIVYLLSYMP